MSGDAHDGAATVLGDCLGVVMAGGEGRRMQGRDKGLLAWDGATLAQHAAARLQAAGLPVRVSANRHLEAYLRMGFDALPDRRAAFLGPLAAIESALYAARQAWVLAVPCDSPFFPRQLPQQLAGAVGVQATGRPVQAAFARCGSRVHPVFCIVSTTLAPVLSRFIDAGGRRVTEWMDAVRASDVDFGSAAEPDFANANSPADYAALRIRWNKEHPGAC